MIFKRLLKSDVMLTPYEANKEFNFVITGSLPTDNCDNSNSDLIVYTGKKISTVFDKDTELMSFGQYQRLIYSQINKIYYQSYTGSLITSSNFDRYDVLTLTDERSDNKYQKIINDDKFINNFPMNEGDEIRVLQINPKLISSKVTENTINLSSSNYIITDDGNGNLFDNSSTSSIHVGNIFYKNGNLVITNQDYVDFFATPPTVYNKTFYFAENLGKSINLNDCIGEGTDGLDYSSIDIITGSTAYTYNLSQSYLYITASNVDDYYFYLKIKDNLGNCSNYGKIDFIVSPSCNVTFSSSFTSSVENPSYIPSFDCGFDVVKKETNFCEIVNTLQLSATSSARSYRNNGTVDYDFQFYSGEEGNWGLSVNGGIEYYVPFASSSIFTGSTVSASFNYSNDYQGIIRFSKNNNFVEYYYKLNPIKIEPIYFEQINKYSSYLNYSQSCYPNIYKVISNGEELSNVNYSSSGDIGFFKTDIDEVSIIGTKGSFTAYITGSSGISCVKTIYINGGMKTDCINEVNLSINKTGLLNNYTILSDVKSKYLASYPQFIVKSGSINFKSNGNSLYSEIEILDKTKDNILNFTFQDFCGTTFSKDLIFQYQFTSSNNNTYGNSFDPVPSTNPPTTPYSPPTTINNTTFRDYVRLSLSQSIDNVRPLNGDRIKVSLTVTNTGITDATNVEVRNLLTSSLVFNSGISFGLNTTGSLLYYTLPRVRVNESIGFEYYLTVTGSYSSSFENKAQIYSCNQYNTGSILGNGVDNNEIDDSSVMIFIQPSGSVNPTSSIICYNYLLTNTTNTTQSYSYYDCSGVFTTGSISPTSGSNFVTVCVTGSNQINTTTSSILITPNGICDTSVIMAPVINSVEYSCDCGNQFFDNTQNVKGRIFVNAMNPNGNLADIEYSFDGDIDVKYQDNNFSNCMPNGLYTVFVRLKSDHSKKVSQRVVIYCGNVSENCNTYRIINDTVDNVTVDYINCSGENISSIVLAETNLDICTRNRDYITMSDDLLSIQQTGVCVQNSSSCDIQLTDIITSIDSIQINATSSVNLAYTLDGGWTWFENTGSFTNLEDGRYVVGVSDTNYRKECFVSYTLVEIGNSSIVSPRIDFYKVAQEPSLLCNQFQSYIYCCITPHNTSGMYQYKVVDKLTSKIVHDWSDPTTNTVVALLVNHGTYQLIVRDSDNLYCQNMFDDIEISFANCI